MTSTARTVTGSGSVTSRPRRRPRQSSTASIAPPPSTSSGPNQGGARLVGSEESAEVSGRVFEVEGGKVTVCDGWQRAASEDKGAKWDPAELGAVVPRLLAESPAPVPVYLLYWTAFVTGQGAVAFREDVYQRDARLAEALGIAISLPRPVDDGSDDPRDVGP